MYMFDHVCGSLAHCCSVEAGMLSISHFVRVYLHLNQHQNKQAENKTVCSQSTSCLFVHLRADNSATTGIRVFALPPASPGLRSLGCAVHGSLTSSVPKTSDWHGLENQMYTNRNEKKGSKEIQHDSHDIKTKRCREKHMQILHTGPSWSSHFTKTIKSGEKRNTS